MWKVVASPELARRLGASARRRAEAEFHLDSHVAEFAALYRRLSETGGNRS